MTIAETSRPSDEQQNRFPLSANLELFCIFDQGDDAGAFGPHDLVIIGWRVAGEIDVEALRGAIDDVVERNEILRTEVIRTEGDRHQRVLPTAPAAKVDVVDLPADDPRPRDERADEFINQVEYYGLHITDMPHVKAVVGRFDERDSVVVLLTHHTASDGWSMQVLMREIAAFYAGRTGAGPAELPEPVQYNEFSEWQQEWLASEEADRSRAYWREKLDGAAASTIPMDEPEGVPYGYAVHRFLWPTELADATKQVARSLRASPFMVLTATFNALMYKMTGQTDLVTGTFIAGRDEPRYADVVGPFFNMIPLRTDLTDCRTFSELVNRTRATCLDSYAHALPYGVISMEAPELNAPFAAGGVAVCAFQVFQFPNAMEETTVGGLTYTEVRKRSMSYEQTSELPNGLVFTLDLLPSGEIAGHIRYNKAEFLPSSIEKLADDYLGILTRATGKPTIALKQL